MHSTKAGYRKEWKTGRKWRVRGQGKEKKSKTSGRVKSSRNR